MNSKVHEAVGLATTLAVMHPDSIPELALGIPMIMIGSILPDIDCNGDSKSKQYFRKTLVYCVLAVILAVLANTIVLKVTGMPIHNRFDFRLLLRIFGFVVFMCICGFGYKRPHREFTHSFLGIVLFTISVIMTTGFRSSMYFAVAMLSHVLIDLLNTKGESLLFPLKGKFCFGVCKASSKTASAIGVVASAIVVLEFYLIVS